MSNIDNLERLNRLRESGALTEEEFRQEKQKLISGKLPDAQKQIFKIAFLVGIILLVVIALVALLWQNQRTENQIVKLEKAAISAPAGKLDLESPKAKDISIAEKAEPASLNNASTKTKPNLANLTFATSTEVLGLNPGYLEKRLGVPREKNSDYIVFEVGGCTIFYSIYNGSVATFEVDVSQNCQPIIQGVKMTPKIKAGQIFDKMGWGEYLASCLYGCGNAANPIAYLTYPGLRATGFVHVYYATDYDQVSSALELWEKAVRRQRGLGEFEPPDDIAAFSCVSKPPAEVIAILRKASIRSVRVEQDDYPYRC